MSSSAASGVSPDVVFEILSNQRRRMVLYYLRQHEGTATVNELAKHIAAMENDVTVGDLTSQQQKRVYVSLYQTHLPKLEATSMIDYDDEEGEVSLTERANEMDSYLTPTADSTYPWQYHYLALALFSAGLLTLALLGVPVVADIPMSWLAIAITAAFVVSTVVHYRQYRREQQQLPAELVERER